MKGSKSHDKFNAIVRFWEQSLDQYSDAEFIIQPNVDSWSIGQVYLHLTGSAMLFHLKNVAACLANPENKAEIKTLPGRITYLLGGMPSVKIKVPASLEYTPPQPKSIADVRQKIETLRQKMAEVGDQLEKFEGESGKTKHPALGYLNAIEWYDLVQMHFKHHRRQKARIDAFLKK